ncbi:MAG: hypothetical protein Q9220_006945 [cf. Caloplaca sp. 1 TL-2023]
MRRPIHLILDFDSTLTTTSTLPLIYRIGYSHNFFSLRIPTWRLISEAYMTDYRNHASKYSVERKILDQELVWLETLKDIERKSFARVRDAGVFRDVTLEDVHREAGRAVKDGEVVMRRGWDELLGSWRREGGIEKVGIVSVGWSAEFIRGCLAAACASVGIDGKGVDVRANEIIDDDEKHAGIEPGEHAKMGKEGLWTARDKRAAMEEIIGPDKEEILVYVGDSATDLECLLAADVGVCVRNEGGMSAEQRELEATLGRVGVDCQWIGHLPSSDLEWEVDFDACPRTKVLWWARDFTDLCQSTLFNEDADSRKSEPYRPSDIAMMLLKAETDECLHPMPTQISLEFDPLSAKILPEKLRHSYRQGLWKWVYGSMQWGIE